MRIKILILTALLSCLAIKSRASAIKIAGPDGSLEVSVSANNGKPVFRVTYNGDVFLENSPLGLRTNVGDFASGLTLGPEATTRKIDERYALATIKHSQVHHLANEGVLNFHKDGEPAFDLIVRVTNNDVAFRYKLHPRGERLVSVIHEEATGFVLPAGTTTYLTPQATPMGGFARTTPSYETPYIIGDQMGNNGWGQGFTFPALFRVNNLGWVLISETGVDGSYCASRLIGHPGGLYTIGFPQEGENNGNGTVWPGIPLPGYTPWRTITVGQTLHPVVETTIAWDVVKPLFEASRDYKFTRGSWSWIMKMDPGTNFDVQKQYIDLSARMGWETVLVDALWDVQIGRERIEELAEYARSRNVYLYLWYNSNGYWNDAPQTPKGLMHTAINRRREMAWMQSIGIKGIKVDFFGGDKQVTMQLYEDILFDANDFGLMVIFHGNTLPRGWERMFPNFASAEAVMASEMLHFSQESSNREAVSAAMHPFARNTVASMDFGGSALNEYWNANNTPGRGSRRVTSDVFAIATAVLFQSPVQHFALAPNNLHDAPGWAIEFMKNVPSTWDETRFIDGYPGRYVVLARRKGTNWYIAAINAQDKTLELELTLPMFQAGQRVTLYTDDANLQGRVSDAKLNRKRQVKLEIPRNGGALIVNKAIN